MEKMKKLLPTQESQLELLRKILSTEGEEVENLEEDIDDITLRRNPAPKAKRKTTNLSNVSGAGDRVYMEFTQSNNQDVDLYNRVAVRHPLFQKRAAKK